MTCRISLLKVGLVALFAAASAGAPSSAHAAGCFWPPVATNPCTSGSQINGGVSGGWVNTGAQARTITANKTGGPRQLHVWFSTSAGGSVVKKAQTIPAWGFATNCTPTSSHVRNLLFNAGAYFAIANAYSVTTSGTCV